MIKGPRGKEEISAQEGKTRNGGRKREKEEDDDAKEEGEERAAKGKSQATCTRQQPPTSEELIINLLSPSPNATVLTRPPSLHFHLRLSLAYHPLARPLCRPSLPLPSLFTLTYPSSLAPFLSLSSRASLRFLFSLLSLFSRPLLRPRCAGLYVYDYDYSYSRFRRTPFTISLSISPPFYRPPNLVATFGLSNAHDAMHAGSRRLKSRLSFRPATIREEKATAHYLRLYYFFEGCRSSLRNI